MARVHRLQHVHGFRSAHFTHDDPIGPHAKGVAEQVPLAHRTGPFEVRRAGLHADHVRLLQLQLGGVLDRHEPFTARNERGKHVQQCRLAGSGAARDQRVHLPSDGRFQERNHFRRAGSHLDEAIWGEALSEAANREYGAVERERWQHGVDARTVWKPSIDHRARFVHATTDPRGDPLNHANEVSLIREGDIDLLEPAAALDVDLIRGVDEYFGDTWIGEQRFEGPEAEDFIDHFFDGPIHVGRRELAIDIGCQPAAERVDFIAKPIARPAVDAREVRHVHDDAVQFVLELEIPRVGPVLGARGSSRHGHGPAPSSIVRCHLSGSRCYFGGADLIGSGLRNKYFAGGGGT